MRYNPSNLSAWWESMQKADARHWTRVSAEVGSFLRDLSGRDELIAVVEPGVGRGAPAVYVPEQAHVEINPEVCAPGTNPADLSMDTEVGRLRHACFAGASVHEGAHAMVSHWELDQRPAMRKITAAALLLEEARAEGHMVREHPETRVLLRATFSTLVKGDGAAETIGQAAHLAALAMARVDAGVLDEAEVADLKAEIVGTLGEELYESLRAVWLKAHALEDHTDQAAMMDLAREWLDLLPEDESEDEEGVTIIVCGMPMPGAGDEGDESDSGSGSGSGKPKESDEGDEGDGSGSGEGDEGNESDESKEGKGGALGKLADAISEAAEDEAAEQVAAAKARDAAAERASEASTEKAAEKAAEKVFSISHGHGYGRGEGISGTENPPAKVRMMANRMARAIQKAQFRERSKTVVASSVPPGRLRSSVAVRRSAQRSQGIPVTAEPWRQTMRKHVDNPPITCGIAVDISGSMSWAAEPVAHLAWALAHAVHRNEGNVATVAYGERVHAVVKPGESPKAMRTFAATGGTEEFIGAIRALDGGLGLANGQGVRMLVIVSDGQYTGGQKSGGTKLLQRLIAHGVKVMWLDIAGGWGTDPVRLPGVEVVKVKKADDMATVVSAAITKALNAA